MSRHGGPLAKLVDVAAVQRMSIPAFEASLRLDPVQTPVNMARLGSGGVALGRAPRAGSTPTSSTRTRPAPG